MVVASMNCPYCDAVISSRRSGRCGVCGTALPASCLFTDEQRSKIEAEMHRLEKHHQEIREQIDLLCDHHHGGPFAPPRLP